MTIPSVVPMVPDVLRRLRALRDDLEYYVEQDGWIILLAWDPSKPRVHEARKMLTLGLNTFDNQIMVDGFSILAMLPPASVWSGELLQVAQNIIDNATHQKVEAVHDQRVAEADGTRADLRGEAHMRDALTSDARSDHRIIFRGKKSFSSSPIRRAVIHAQAERAEFAAAKRREREFVQSVALMQRFPNAHILR